jgi:hypothetical protein
MSSETETECGAKRAHGHMATRLSLGSSLRKDRRAGEEKEKGRGLAACSQPVLQLREVYGLICQFSTSCPALCPPHMPRSPGSYHLGAWDGVGTARTTQSGRYGPEKLSRAACATEHRWGPFLPVPSRGTRRHGGTAGCVRASNRHAARAIAGNSRPRGGFAGRGNNPPFTNPSFGNLVACVLV